MTQAAPSTYVIPDVNANLRSFRKIWLMLPLLTLAAFAWGYHRRGIDGALDLMGAGFVAGLVLSLAALIPVAIVGAIRQKAVWSKHTFDWYRNTFPAHAHAQGRVSCRHCGGHHVRAERLMNKTFMRVHSCGQCGKTLYYSPEQR